MTLATLSTQDQHAQIIAAANALKPILVTHPQAQQHPSMRLAVKAIDESGNYRNSDVVVPLSIAYRKQSAAQRTINDKFGHRYTVLSALSTNDEF